jgi:TDG/mug DNA glycosylase family protein
VDERPLRGALGLPPLPDHLAAGLKLVFIGFNPGERSAQAGHYYAYPGNRFWWLLWQSGLTERLLKPEEDRLLLTYGYGLTDLVDRPSKSSNELAYWEMTQGRNLLLAKLRHLRPRIACYNGKGVFAAAAGIPRPTYGLQPTSIVPGTRDFVAASPSGRSREPIAQKLQLYKQLKMLAEERIEP